MLELIPLHHVILLNALLHSYELNTLDACWIAVDVWSNSSRCRNHFGLHDMDVMPILMIIALDIVISFHFSISCSTVICLPTVLFSFKRIASTETCVPRCGSPGLRGPRTAGLHTWVRLLGYEDTRQKTSSRVWMGLSFVWMACLVIQICRFHSL